MLFLKDSSRNLMLALVNVSILRADNSSQLRSQTIGVYSPVDLHLNSLLLLLISWSYLYGWRLDRIAAEDVEIRGIKVNKGTAVTAAIYVMHRSEDYFENPDNFQPERLNLYNACFPICFGLCIQKTKLNGLFTLIPGR